MNDSIPELQRKLKLAQERERLETVQCSSCEGRGWFCDTTYDRTGVDYKCSVCYGTGFPKKRVEEILLGAFQFFQKPAPGVKVT